MRTVERGTWQHWVERLHGVEYRFGLVTAESPVHRIEFGPGLTDAEVARVERTFGFRFPPDLREFLQTALPRGAQFPDWRSGDDASLRAWLDEPRRGVLFDVQSNAFWLDEWGPRPSDLDEVSAIVEELLRAAPRLIPIYGHRMIPDEPHEAGNPVFSVHQTDIIHYGFDLENYLCAEFHFPDERPVPSRMRPIRFWDIDRFQSVRWSAGPVLFDNRAGDLPK
jgi:hypothetical protein